MRRAVIGVTLTFIGGLLTYEAIALAASFVALAIACYALWRVDQADRRQVEREQSLQARADALGDEIRDDLAGG